MPEKLLARVSQPIRKNTRVFQVTSIYFLFCEMVVARLILLLILSVTIVHCIEWTQAKSDAQQTNHVNL